MEFLILTPIIILLGMIVAVIYFSTKIFKFKKQPTTSKRRPIFFLFYTSLLVVALVISVIFPNQQVILKDYSGDYEGGVYFNEIMNEERSIDSIAPFKQSEETYPITGDTLKFNETNLYAYNQPFNMLIVQDPSLTDTYTVETYETPYIYNGRDISAYVPHAEVNGIDGVVYLRFPEGNAVLKMYDLSFPFKQFAKDKEDFTGWESYQLPSDHMTVLYIPEDITLNVDSIVNNNDVHVEMIEKK